MLLKLFEKTAPGPSQPLRSNVEGQGQRPRGATLHPRLEAVAETSYPTSKVRSSCCALLEHP